MLEHAQVTIHCAFEQTFYTPLQLSMLSASAPTSSYVHSSVIRVSAWKQN